MCGGVDGPSYDSGPVEICTGCKRQKWMCNCLSPYSWANKPINKNTTKRGLKERINKNRKLAKSLRK